MGKCQFKTKQSSLIVGIVNEVTEDMTDSETMRKSHMSASQSRTAAAARAQKYRHRLQRWIRAVLLDDRPNVNIPFLSLYHLNTQSFRLPGSLEKKND